MSAPMNLLAVLDVACVAASNKVSSCTSDTARDMAQRQVDNLIAVRGAVAKLLESHRPPSVGYIVTDPTKPDGLPWIFNADYVRDHTDGVPIFKTRDPVVPARLAPPETELEFLESWLRFWSEPVGQECCGYADPQQGCCGNAVAVYNTPDDVREAMNARHAQLVSQVTSPTPQNDSISRLVTAARAYAAYRRPIDDTDLFCAMDDALDALPSQYQEATA